MDEEEWLACETSEAMVKLVPSTASERKVRLFACACCHRVRDRFFDDVLWGLVEVSERYADGQATQAEMAQLARTIYQKYSNGSNAFDGYGASLDTVGSRLYHAPEGVVHEESTYDIHDAWGAAWDCSEYVVVDRYWYLTGDPGRGSAHKRVPPEKTAELAAQSELLRDIFGNPFRPVAFAPEWKTDTAVALARTMYDSRDFSAMPILADALQDAGCDNDDILSHCRGDGPHVRGCWVVDLVLGKE